MWDDYSEVFSEPSAADTIILEAQGKLKDLFTDEIRRTLDKARDAAERLKDLETEIRCAKMRLDSYEEQCKRKREELDTIDKNYLPRGFAQKLVAELTGGFAPEDTVWVNKYDGHYEECPVCEGKKKISATIDGGKKIKISCQKCNGNGRIFTGTYRPEGRTVKEVVVKLCVENSRCGVWTYDTIYLYGSEDNVRPDNLFKTLEQCQAACDEINARANGDVFD